MVGLRQCGEVNKFSSFLLRYQPSAINTLPLISPIAHEILAKNNGRCSKLELIKAFETDPFLSARILGKANSILFNRNHHIIYTVREAFDMVGIEHAFRVLHDAPKFGFNLPGTENKLRNLWTRWITVAHAAQMLLTYAGVTALNKDAMFVVGLIHDIGHLLELHYDPGRLGSITRSSESCKHVNGTMPHTSLGESLARAWALPDCMVQAIRWHHSPDQCPTSVGRELAALVYLADKLAAYCLAKQPIKVEACTTALAITNLKEKHLHIVFTMLNRAPYRPLPYTSPRHDMNTIRYPRISTKTHVLNRRVGRHDNSSKNFHFIK